MDKKTIALVVVICAVVFSVGIFAGRFIMLTETPVSTPINEIEYPVTAYFALGDDSVQITLNEEGSAFYKENEKGDYGNWKITGSTSTRIEYWVGVPRKWECEIWLFSNHGAIFDPGQEDIPGYWR